MNCSDKEYITSIVVHGVRYDIKRSNVIDRAVVDHLIKWFKEVKCVYGECLIQDDDAFVRASEELADILDNVLKPECSE
jgi:hypothetical protein